MRKIPTSVLAIFSFLGFAVICFVITIYAIHSHIHWLGDVDKEFFGIFGEFIGGVVGTLFSIITTVLVYLTYNAQQKDVGETKKLLQKQMDLSIKPDLFFTNSTFYGFSKMNVTGQGYALDFSNNIKAMTESINYNVSVDLVNIGVGVAKNIEYSWDFDLGEIQKYLDDNFDNNPLKIDSIAESLIELKIEGFQSIHMPNRYYKTKKRFDILLSHREAPPKLSLQFPTPYLVCYFIGIQLSLLHRNKKLISFMAFENFPKCKLHLSYKDISEKKHKKTFDFLLSSHGSFVIKPTSEKVLMFGYDLYAAEI